MALLAPLAMVWLCVGINRIHGNWTDVGPPEGRFGADRSAGGLEESALIRTKAISNVTRCFAAQGGIMLPDGVE